jgi:UDP-N-acetylglucosamine 2-epimerase
VIDALLYIHQRGQLVASVSPPPPRTILITMHRRESYGAPFERICRAIQIVAERYPEVRFQFPMHPAPKVRRPARRFLEARPNIELHEPLRYPDFVAALGQCHFVLTDSGGVQEEAPALAKPVLVLRKRTERPEAIRAGTARLVGTSTETIVDAAEELLSDPAAYDLMARAANPFGDGRASSRVALSYRFGFIDSPPLEFFETVRSARELATAS